MDKQKQVLYITFLIRNFLKRNPERVAFWRQIPVRQKRSSRHVSR